CRSPGARRAGAGDPAGPRAPPRVPGNRSRRPRTAGSSRSPLLRVVHRARLADHGDADLARILELLLDPARDVARQALRARIVDTVVLHDDAHFAPGLDGITLLHARERVGDALQRLEPLDVGLDALASRARARAADRVGRAHQHRPQAAARVVVVMVADRLEHGLRLAVARPHLHAERRVRALLALGVRLADVAPEAAATGQCLGHA